MKIAIICAGNVGGTLALGWTKAGHEIIIGGKDPNSSKVKKVITLNSIIKVKSVKDASQEAEVILIAATSSAVTEISKQLLEVKDKVIIDVMNSIAVESAGYPNSFEAIKAFTNCENVL